MTGELQPDEPEERTPLIRGIRARPGSIPTYPPAEPIGRGQRPTGHRLAVGTRRLEYTRNRVPLLVFPTDRADQRSGRTRFPEKDPHIESFGSREPRRGRGRGRTPPAQGRGRPAPTAGRGEPSVAGILIRTGTWVMISRRIPASPREFGIAKM